MQLKYYVYAHNKKHNLYTKSPSTINMYFVSIEREIVDKKYPCLKLINDDGPSAFFFEIEKFAENICSTMVCAKTPKN